MARRSGTRTASGAPGATMRQVEMPPEPATSMIVRSGGAPPGSRSSSSSVPSQSALLLGEVRDLDERSDADWRFRGRGKETHGRERKAARHAGEGARRSDVAGTGERP